MAVAFAYPVHVAETEKDIKAFNERHIQDTSVLYFVNLSSKTETGFWASLFSLFGSSSESDETYLLDIAENNPVLKIDVGQDELVNATKPYNVTSIPYVVAFHKGLELLREAPYSSTADRIDNAVRDKEEKALNKVNPKFTAHPERNGTDVVPNDEKKPGDVHHHPAPLTVIPDFGHMSTNDPAESSLISATPIQDLDKKTHANELNPQAIPVVSVGDDQLIVYKNGANTVVDVSSITNAIPTASVSPSVSVRPTASASASAPRHQPYTPSSRAPQRGVQGSYSAYNIQNRYSHGSTSKIGQRLGRY